MMTGKTLLGLHNHIIFEKGHFIEHVEIFKKHFPFLHSLTRKETTKTSAQKFSFKFSKRTEMRKKRKVSKFIGY